MPKQVVSGNAFQIQYIITDPSSLVNITTPQFDNLQLVSGPNYYKGNSLINGKDQAIENITYTVVPLKEGTIQIGPMIAKFKNGEDEKTNKIVIKAIAQPKASFNMLSTYTDINLYAPSSKADLDQLIEANLFVRTEVDKQSCFLGEAVTATFKLYSRLQSTSEVINAPSLYGFSVMDMLDINEAHQAVETIDGKIFNTSILRKLQLYPAQTGKLTIDEMQLQNTIEFKDSITGKKLKVEKLLASNPVEIVVKPLPSKEPGGFTGATGKFEISAELPKSTIEANAQGKLIVTISGNGNFIQFGPPAINWPAGFDVFDPVESDELDRNTVPTSGKRKYIFHFTSNQTGDYTIPPISFSFFDPQSAKYKKAISDSLKLSVVPSSANEKENTKKLQAHPSSKWWLYSLIAAILIIAFVYSLKKKKQTNIQPPVVQTSCLQKFESIKAMRLPGKAFCFQIQKLLAEISKEYYLSEAQIQELKSIQNDCQLQIYSDMDSEGKKDELERRAENLLKQIS